jgi:hypothetical protein
MNRDLKEIREHIYKVFARCGAIPKGADIVLCETDGWQTVVQCTWKPPTQTGFSGGKATKEITLQLTGLATKRFLEADDGKLMHLDSRLLDIVEKRILQGYKETGSETGPFIIRSHLKNNFATE